MRVATYTRISTDEENQPYSLEAQADRLSSFIHSQDGWEPRRKFTDQMSGSTLDRPGLEQALAEARLGAFDLLLVYRVDRLSRSVRGLAQILEELDHAGVAFRSATEPFDTATPAGRMMVQMLGVFAEFERATLIDRVISGMERKAATGRWCGGTPPFGYRPDPETGFLAPKKGEAALVPKVFELYARRRLGSHAIAGWLNERGHRTIGGRPWGHKAILSLLQNRAYVGENYYRGKHHPAPQQPLVDRELFAAAQQLLEERQESHSLRASNSNDYLLTGVVFCAACGKRYLGTAARGNGGTYHYYTCFSRNQYGTPFCSADRIAAPALESAILQSMLQTYENRGLLRKAAREAYRKAGADRPRRLDQVAAVEVDIRKTEESVERYFLAFENGTMKAAQCSARLDGLSTKLAELRSRLAELQFELGSAGPDKIGEDDLDYLCAEVKRIILEGNPPERKRLVQALVEEIRVESKHAIHPRYRLPHSPVRELGGLVDLTGSCSNFPELKRALEALARAAGWIGSA
jgi:site-specific DNA recombinase